jgi:hypothetical protein|tara:strand:- start:329 stop:673 length:345 start_codon:yes stop_codon:yes gene_type:complete
MTENKGFLVKIVLDFWLVLVYSISIITIMLLYNKKVDYMRNQDTHKELVDSINNVNAIIQIQNKRELFKENFIKEMNKTQSLNYLNIIRCNKKLELSEDINYHISLLEQKIKNI